MQHCPVTQLLSSLCHSYSHYLLAATEQFKPPGTISRMYDRWERIESSNYPCLLNIYIFAFEAFVHLVQTADCVLICICQTDDKRKCHVQKSHVFVVLQFVLCKNYFSAIDYRNHCQPSSSSIKSKSRKRFTLHHLKNTKILKSTPFSAVCT